MSILQEKRYSWDIIFNDANLSEASLRQRAISGPMCERGLRSVCWKIFLGYLPNVDVSTWPSILLDERNKYTELRRKHIEEPAELMSKKNDNLTDNNPLALSESNPWQQYFADSEIRKIIRQDVDRTFPDIEFFRDEKIQEKMTDILFIYCKIHHDVSYRQGMHELLAPFFWVIATESIQDVSKEDLDQFKSIDSINLMIAQVLDSDFIEHDAYLLFDKLMSYAKPWYEYNNTVQTSNSLLKSTPDAIGNSSQISSNLNPVVGVCQRIHHQLLRSANPPLYKHLESFGIEPQLYGIRWLRLLFGREFEFHELLKLWDGIFAQDPTLNIVEYVCLAILLRLHDQLIDGDYADCLTLLMRGTQISKPVTLVEQAKYLQGNLSHDGALQILQQNDIRLGKEPRESLWKNEENVTLDNHHYHQQQQRDLPFSHNQRTSNQNFNGLSNLTRGVMKSPQVRDFNKAIAGVMGTVQKNVNLFGDNMLGRSSDGQYNRRRLTVSSEFPDSIDHITTQRRSKTTLLRSSSNSNIHQSSSTKDDAATLKALMKMNRQMGDLMAQCITVLEKELFPSQPQSSSSPSSSTIIKKDIATSDTHPINDLENMCNVKKSETATETAATATVEDNSPTLESIDTTIIFNNSSKDMTNTLNDEKIEMNEASIIFTLAGLKHIRDVLQGKQQQFDNNILDYQSISKYSPKIINNKNDIDHNDNNSNSSNSNNNINTKTSDNEWTIIDSVPKKPLSEPQQQIVNTTRSPLVQKSSPSPPLSSYISSSPLSSKQHVTYSIEDLLSDTEYQKKNEDTKPSHHSVNNKFKWMVDGDNKDSNETANILDATKSTNTLSSGGSHALFDDISNNSIVPTSQHLRQMNRKRSSLILNKNTQQNSSTSSSSSVSQIDPLDAKNLDKRYFYEYDMYH